MMPTSVPVLPADKSWIEIIQAVLTIAALLIGAGWVIYRIYKLRTFAHRANFTHSFFAWRIASDLRLIRLSVRATNCGDVRLPLLSHVVWIRQIRPVPDVMNDTIAQASKCEICPKLAADWPLIGETTEHLDDAEIEPGEWHEFHFDFVIKPDVQTVLAYTYFKSTAKKTKGLIRRKPHEFGWKVTTLHELEVGDEPNVENPNDKANAATGFGREQAKQARSTPQSTTS